MKASKYRKYFYITAPLILAAAFIAFSVSGPEKSGCWSADLQCWQESIENDLTQKGLDQAFETLAELYATEPAFAAECHSFTHLLGEKAYERFSEEGKVELTPQASYCSYGFYHGFMETMVLFTGSYDKVRDFCADINNQLESYGLNLESECYHGIGHGAVISHDLIKKDALAEADKALRICTEVINGNVHKLECATGVFNGIANEYNEGKYELSPDGREPLRLCREQHPFFKSTCYGYIARVLMRLNDNDLEKALAFAEEKIEKAHLGGTVKNLVITDVSKRHKDAKISGLVDACKQLPLQWASLCIENTALGLLQNGVPGSEYQRPVELCQSDLLNDQEKAACIANLLPELHKLYGTANLARACGELEEPYETECLNQ